MKHTFSYQSIIACALLLGIFQPLTPSFSMNLRPIVRKLTKKCTMYWNFLRGGAYLDAGPVFRIKPTVSLKDLVGLDHVKNAFYELIYYIDNPEQLRRIEAMPDQYWLLSGPARSGKTFSVECLCGQIELHMAQRGKANTMKFFHLSAGSICKDSLDDLYDELQKDAPVLIFIDELEYLDATRTDTIKLLSDFVTAIASLVHHDPAKIVVLIMATNKPENNTLLLRPFGKFFRELQFDCALNKPVGTE